MQKTVKVSKNDTRTKRKKRSFLKDVPMRNRKVSLDGTIIAEGEIPSAIFHVVFQKISSSLQSMGPPTCVGISGCIFVYENHDGLLLFGLNDGFNAGGFVLLVLCVFRGAFVIQKQLVIGYSFGTNGLELPAQRIEVLLGAVLQPTNLDVASCQ